MDHIANSISTRVYVYIDGSVKSLKHFQIYKKKEKEKQEIRLHESVDPQTYF